MPFKKGQSGNPKGAKPGVHNIGRSPDWLKQHTRDIIERDKLVERLAKIAKGDDFPQPISNGEVIDVPAPLAEQRKAILDLIDRGYGKPNQSLEVTGDTASELAVLPATTLIEIVEALKGGKI